MFVTLNLKTGNRCQSLKIHFEHNSVHSVNATTKTINNPIKDWAKDLNISLKKL